jgi:hypothetical protein
MPGLPAIFHPGLSPGKPGERPIKVFLIDQLLKFQNDACEIDQSFGQLI